jgi:hypothetical protein
MPPSTSLPSPPDPLQPVLDDAEAELRRRLHEACEAEAKGLSTDSAQEVRRLEDTLLAAAVAAEQTITVRRHMKHRATSERERPIRINEAADRKGNTNPRSDEGPEESGREHGQEPDTRVREFTDERGLAWRAWPVIPGLSRASASGRSFLGNFQDGWICFEGLSTTARRRLPCRRPNWSAITDEDLRHLLAQAIDAPDRATKRQGKP